MQSVTENSIYKYYGQYALLKKVPHILLEATAVSSFLCTFSEINCSQAPLSTSHSSCFLCLLLFDFCIV